MPKGTFINVNDVTNCLIVTQLAGLYVVNACFPVELNGLVLYLVKVTLQLACSRTLLHVLSPFPPNVLFLAFFSIVVIK